jgi:hypothetical protein
MGKNQDPEPEINIPDPQHSSEQNTDLNIAEVMPGSLDLPGLALRGVLHVEDGPLAERGVVVKAQLGVSCINLNIKKRYITNDKALLVGRTIVAC